MLKKHIYAVGLAVLIQKSMINKSMMRRKVSTKTTTTGMQTYTYGPLSDGVNGSEGGGGRFIRVGAFDDIPMCFTALYMRC